MKIRTTCEEMNHGFVPEPSASIGSQSVPSSAIVDTTVKNWGIGIACTVGKWLNAKPASTGRDGMDTTGAAGCNREQRDEPSIITHEYLGTWYVPGGAEGGGGNKS